MAHLPSTSASASASTSTSTSASAAASPNTNYSSHFDVFINCSASDVTNNFAGHLFRRLLDRGFRAFLDRPEVQPGGRLDSRIEGAIATASVHIPIFSQKYAQSERCLDELLLILKSKAPIVPVFYDVKPPELRIRTGEGQEGGHENKRSCSQQTIADWKKALSDVSQLNGLELEACEGDEGELVHRILQRAEEEVAKPQFQVGKYVIGLDKKLEDFEKAVLLQRQQHKGEAKFVGIVGVDGVGKTTLATEFFNRKRSAYHRSCFLSDVREAAGRSSLPSLQSKLIKDLTTLDHEIVSVAEGKKMLSRYLFNLPVLVILDDVDDVQQMDALYSPLKYAFRSSSLILVISRNKDILEKSGMRESDIYNLTGLDREHSQELFCLHAFHKRLPAFRFKEVVPKFLDVCGGLPLCLKVLGALVYQKDLKYWKTPLRKISLVLPADVQSILKISCDSLDDQEKDIFLDIACFLNGEDRDTVISIWDASGWVGWLNLQNLVNKCLVDIDNKSRISMHPRLIDLGRDLAEKNPSRFRRRLWRPNENHFDNAWKNSTVRGINMVEVRSGSSVNDAVEVDIDSKGCIRMHDHIRDLGRDLPEKDPSRFRRRLWRPTDNRFHYAWQNSTVLEDLEITVRGINMVEVRSGSSVNDAVEVDMSRLQLLKAEGDCLESISTLLAHSDLLWLCWNRCPYTSLPSWIPRKNLRALRVAGSKLETLWLHESEAPLNLRELIIDAATANFQLPKSIGQLEYLETIELRCTMEPLPAEFFHLTSLKHLRMYASEKSLTLPESFGNLTNLRDLDFTGCSALKWLPESFGNLMNLRDLHLSGCSQLQELPNSLGSLTAIQQFDLSGCSQLQKLPDCVGNLASLQQLDLSWCSNLQALPDSVGNLTGLQQLNLSSCSNLQQLPDSVGNLTGLQQLNLSSCSNLQALPDSVGNLTGLQRLDLSWCSQLQKLPDSVRNLTGLLQINLSSCSGFQELPNSLGSLTALQQFDLSGCSRLGKLPDSLGNLTGLLQLNLSSSSGFKELPNSLGSLTALQQFDLSDCSQLQKLADSVGNLTGLLQLNLSSCSGFQELPNSFWNLESLEILDMSGCSNLQALPDSFGNQQLDLLACSQLQKLPASVGNLTVRLQLNLSSCSGFQELPNSIVNLQSLQFLDLPRCSRLQMLPDSFGNRRGLQHIELLACSQLQKLRDNAGNLTVRLQLNLSSCSGFQELPNSLVNLRSLQYLHRPESFQKIRLLRMDPQQLDLSICFGFEKLPNSLGSFTGLQLPLSYGNLQGLRQLDLSSCFGFEKLPNSLGSFTGLQHLDLSRCSRLQMLPDSFGNLRGLQHLDLLACSQLQELPDSVGNLTGLQQLNLSGCSQLQELPDSVGNLTGLQQLNLSGCSQLQKLPDSVGNLTGLHRLNLSGCSARLRRESNRPPAAQLVEVLPVAKDDEDADGAPSCKSCQTPSGI